jgi:putative hydrolase of the HAD superfamily
LTDLPRAILFDLDDTILSAYARPEAAWLSVAEQFADELAPLSIVEVVDRIIACSREFWSDPERHRVWRQRLFEARRENVVAAFSELAAQGGRFRPPTWRMRWRTGFQSIAKSRCICSPMPMR